MTRRRKVLIGAALALPAVLAGEAVIASRVERIDGFTGVDLDGRLGSGGEPLRIVWIGDSTGSGVGASDRDHVLSRVVAAGLRRAVDLTVLAVSGATVRDAIDEQLPELGALRPDWVFIGIGNNDVTHLTPRSRFRARFDQLLRGVAAAAQASRVIVLGIAEFAGTPLLRQPLRFFAGVRAHRMDALVREIARKHNALYIPIRALTGPRFIHEPRRYHARDLFHPNDAGYALWADATLDTLRAEGG